MSKTKTRTLPAQQLMIRDPRCCAPDTTLNEAARLLWEADCGALPVVDGEKVVAMLTDRDICMAAYTQNRPLSQLRAETAMSSRLVTCRPDDDVDTVQQRMREAQVRRIPVVDDAGRLQGILSLNDLAREALKPEGALSRADVAETLGHICERQPELVAPS